MQYQKNHFWAVTVTTQKPRSIRIILQTPYFMSYAWPAYKGNLVYIICIWQSQQQRKDKNRQFSKKVQATMAITQLITIQSAGDFPPTKHKHKPVL